MQPWMPDPAWENNPKWLESESAKRFAAYRTQRNEQQAEAWKRKMMKREMDNIITRIDGTNNLESLGSITELEQRGLLKMSHLSQSDATAKMAFVHLHKQIKRT
eukprot:TRINITY_DN6861_c0_g1_i2.p1 TRINITY_DN6861_c0_g1~~TRINITY_DN6861_c0_g1_i2.p1  ORF type:complete len:104 (-),score=24.38 TRINITY_DN6861_c0_g1_i2:147-458(-)